MAPSRVMRHLLLLLLLARVQASVDHLPVALSQDDTVSFNNHLPVHLYQHVVYLEAPLQLQRTSQTIDQAEVLSRYVNQLLLHSWYAFSPNYYSAPVAAIKKRFNNAVNQLLDDVTLSADESYHETYINIFTDLLSRDQPHRKARSVNDSFSTSDLDFLPDTPNAFAQFVADKLGFPEPPSDLIDALEHFTTKPHPLVDTPRLIARKRRQTASPPPVQTVSLTHTPTAQQIVQSLLPGENLDFVIPDKTIIYDTFLDLLPPLTEQLTSIQATNTTEQYYELAFDLGQFLISTLPRAIDLYLKDIYSILAGKLPLDIFIPDELQANLAFLNQGLSDSSFAIQQSRPHHLAELPIKLTAIQNDMFVQIKLPVVAPRVQTRLFLLQKSTFHFPLSNGVLRLTTKPNQPYLFHNQHSRSLAASQAFVTSHCLESDHQYFCKDVSLSSYAPSCAVALFTSNTTMALQTCEWRFTKHKAISAHRFNSTSFILAVQKYADVHFTCPDQQFSSAPIALTSGVYLTNLENCLYALVGPHRLAPLARHDIRYTTRAFDISHLVQLLTNGNSLENIASTLRYSSNYHLDPDDVYNTPIDTLFTPKIQQLPSILYSTSATTSLALLFLLVRSLFSCITSRLRRPDQTPAAPNRQPTPV